MLWYLSSRTGCNCGTSFHHAEACAFQGHWSSWRRDCTDHTRNVCLQSAFSWFVLCSAFVVFNQSGNKVGDNWMSYSKSESQRRAFLKSESRKIGNYGLEMLSCSKIGHRDVQRRMHNYLSSLWMPMSCSKQQCSSQYSCGLGLVIQCCLCFFCLRLRAMIRRPCQATIVNNSRSGARGISTNVATILIVN